MKAALTGLLQKLSKRDLAVLIVAAALASACGNVIPGTWTVLSLPVNVLSPAAIITLALAYVYRKLA
jgi:hypothetical protein